jgi:hypothetical protein
MIDNNEYKLANERARLRKSGPTAVSVIYDSGHKRVVIKLSTGFDISFFPRDVQGLEAATPNELKLIEISPSGLGIHFPAIDADIYLPGLLEGAIGSKNWMAAQMGSLGGSVKSDAKAKSSRANGLRGGRPKKPAGSTT